MTAIAMPAAGGWPWPGENAVARARRITQSYRQALSLNNRRLRDELDAGFVELGETWVLGEQEITYNGDGMDALTTAEAAEVAHVPTYEINRWACMEWPGEPGRPLLPRFKPRGRTMTYLAGDVVAAARVRRGSVGLPSMDT